MVDSETSVESIVEYVINWVEARYKDDEILSIALFTVNHCLMNAKPKGSILAYIMRSVYNAVISYKVDHINPLPDDIADLDKGTWSIPYEILDHTESVIVRMKYEEQYNIQGIADYLGLTYTQAKYKLHNAHNKLRFWYEKYSEG